jgi:hypothetical protein
MTRFADAPVERHYEGAQLAGTEGFCRHVGLAVGRAKRRPPCTRLMNRQSSKRGQEADGLDATENSLIR